LTYKFIWLTAEDKQDVTHVVDLIEQVSVTEPFIGLPTAPNPADIARLTGKLLDGLASGQTHLLAVRDPNGTTVGCVAVNRPSTANQRHIGELVAGAVHPDYRGRKVVTGAFAAVVRHCEQIGIDLLRLDVREGIRAERIWRSYGFEEYGRLADYGRVGNEKYTGIYLAQPVARLRSTIVNREVAHAQQG